LRQGQADGEVDAELLATAVVLVRALAAIVGDFDVERLDLIAVALALALRIEANVHLAAGQTMEQVVGVLLDFGQHRLDQQRLDAVAPTSVLQFAQQADVGGQRLLLRAQPVTCPALVAQHLHLLAGGAADANGRGVVVAQAG